MIRWIAEHRRSAGATAIATAVAVALGIVVVTHEGIETTNVELHDGGVWVTNQELQRVGHLNVEVEEIDMGFAAQSGAADIHQHDGQVLLTEASPDVLSVVSPSTATVGDSAELPPRARVSLGGTTVTILAPTDGMLWALPIEAVAGFNPERTDPIAQLGAGAAAVADVHGDVHAASADGEILSWERTGAEFGTPSVQAAPALAESTALSITAVGDTPVALNRDTGAIVTPGGSVIVDGKPELQQRGPASDRVLAATGTDLVRIPLRGGDLERAEYGTGGAAVAPVQVNGCAYGVWPGAGRAIRDCGDPALSLDERFDRDAGVTVLREMRGTVAINSVVTGTVWLMSDELIRVDNWADLLPPPSEEESDEQDDAESADSTTAEEPPPTAEQNQPPIAEDDEIFGARPGRSTVLPVLWNDSDPDGDVLTVSPLGELPEGFRVTAVANRSALQIEVPESTSTSTVRFQYEVNDGRGGTDTAWVTVPIRAAGENSPPKQLRDQSFAVEQRATFEYRALESWYDPDGDDLFVVGAASASGDTVQHKPDGTIIYTATGEPGPTQLELTVSDGIATAQEVVQVEVLARGTGAPVAHDDYLALVEGQQGSVRPLANDAAPSGDTLRLASVTARGGLELQTDLAGAQVTVLDGAPGTHFIDYVVAAGAGSAQGVIRVDIEAAPEEAAPIAVRDVLLLPIGGTATVDVLANDIDPSGGVLVVQSIQTPSGQVGARLIGRQFVEVTDSRGQRDPFVISYTVANSVGTADGQIMVVPVPPRTDARAPVARDDRAALREGDFTSVDVVANDFSPDDVPFTVSRILETSMASAAEGVAFVRGDDIRVHAPVGAVGPLSVVYEVVDDLGQRATAEVTVDVIARNPDENRAPIAVDVEARVLAGGSVQIPIPLQGIDPDGDGVMLVGLSTAPAEGRVTESTGGSLVYEAFEASRGTDSFRYTVRDRWGAEATGEVTVGIAQPAGVNQPPVARADTVTVRPERAIAVDVLANDSDPDGDTISLVDTGFEGASAEISDAHLDDSGSLVVFTSPAEPGSYSIPYRIQDNRGAQSAGLVLVTVDREAPLLAPVAVDDVVEAEQLEQGVPFTVPVLENDRDDDGSRDDLVVDVVAGPGRVVEGGIQVVPSAEFTVVAYRITDVDGLSATAFVFVPSSSSMQPYLSPRVSELTIGSGLPLSIRLADVIIAPSGRPVEITDPDRVRATRTNGEPLVVSPTELRYVSQEQYVGRASISVEVTDGGADGEQANVALITIPINVIPSSAVAPTFQGAVVTVEPGERSEPLDLRALTVDPDEGDLAAMRYERLGDDRPGLRVTVSDGILIAHAEHTAAAGDELSVDLRITDPAQNSAAGVVVVRVVSSSAPLAETRPDSADAVQGEPVVIYPLRNDINPFAADGQPLRVVSAAVVGGDAGVDFDDSTVTVTPGDDFAGRLSVEYRAADATGAVDRMVTGLITVAVQGRPDAPPRPNIGSVGNAAVTLSWAAPADNGAPITGYLVHYQGGQQRCESTTCTVSGLRNGQTYAFTVTAVNSVGESEPSGESVPVTPDVPPARPAAPSAVRGDSQVTLHWPQPANQGSAITHYAVAISPPAPDGTTQREVSTESLVWTGLANGTEYRFSVQAHNAADEPSEFGPESQPAKPAGLPTAPQSVSAQRDGGSGSTVPIVVDWDAADGNGEDIRRYLVTPVRGGVAGEPVVVLPTALPVTLQQPVSSDPVVFRVIAENAIGAGPAAESAPIVAVNPPAAPRITAAVGGDGSTSLTFAAGDTGGARASEVAYYYTLDGGTRRGPIEPGTVSIPTPNRSQAPYTYSIRVIAETVIDGVAYTSEPSDPMTAQPYGAPPQPVADQVDPGLGKVYFRWLTPVANGRPFTLYVELEGGDVIDRTGEEQITAHADTVTVPTDFVLRLWTVDDLGNRSATTTMTGTTEASQQLTARRGGYAAGALGSECMQGGYFLCNTTEITWNGLINTGYNVTCTYEDGAIQRSGTIILPGPSGTADLAALGATDCTAGGAGEATIRIYGATTDVSVTYYHDATDPGR